MPVLLNASILALFSSASFRESRRVCVALTMTPVQDRARATVTEATDKMTSLVLIDQF